MKMYTVKEFQNNFDNLIDRVENGEKISIVNDDGKVAVMLSVDDELVKIHTELNNEAP